MLHERLRSLVWGKFAALGLIQTANDEQEPDDIRYQAIATLGEFADRAAMTKLLPLARSLNPNLRAAARLSMSKRGVPVEIKDLVVSTIDSEVNVFTALGLVQHLEEMSGQRFLNADDVDEVEAARRRVSLWWTESTGAQDVHQGPRARLHPALE
ncbi:MAG: HEAT repeat domain-containing protein [Pseudomonadota bacterium]